MAYSYDYICKFNEEFTDKHKLQISLKLNQDEKKVLDHVLYGADWRFNSNSRSYVQIAEQRIDKLSDFVRQNYGKVVSIVVPEEFTDDFYNACDSFVKFQYSRSYYRRSYRCRDAYPHAQNIFHLMNDYYLMRMIDIHPGAMRAFLCDDFADDVTRSVYLSMRYRDNIITERINAGDEEVISLIKDMMTSENNTNVLTYQTIRAIIMSDNAELHDLLCGLLLAARLSEGLRQAICESADCGTAEAFIKLIKTINDNNLVRFPSIRRAVGTWSGVCKEGDPERTAQKLLEDMVYVLESREKCIEYIYTTDAVHIYCGLWGLSFYDIDDAVDVIYDMVGLGKGVYPRANHEMQLLTAGYFCNDVEVERAAQRISAAVIEAYPNDPKMFSMFYDNYPYFVFGVNLSAERGEFAGDKDRARLHYNKLLELYNSMTKKSIKYDPIVFPWFASETTKSRILRSILGTALVLDDDDIFDYLSDKVLEFDSGCRSDLIKAIGDRLHTQKQRQTVINAAADKETYTRGKAVVLIKKISLSDDEVRVIEGFARYKNVDLRNGIISILKERPLSDVRVSIKRMLETTDENTRLAALDILTTAIKENSDIDFSDEISAAAAISQPTDREQILINALTSSSGENEVSAENGFGIYDPNCSIAYADIEPSLSVIQDFFSVTADEITQMELDLMKIVDENSTLEYKDYSGEERMLGNFGYLYARWSSDAKEREKQRLCDVTPFADLWSRYYRESIRTPKRFWSLYLYSTRNKVEDLKQESRKKLDANLDKLFGVIYTFDREKELCKKDERFAKSSFYPLQNSVLECAMSEFELEIPKDVIRHLFLYIIRKLPDDELLLEREKPRGNFYGSSSDFEFLDISVIRKLLPKLTELARSEEEMDFRIAHEMNVKKKYLCDILEAKKKGSRSSSFSGTVPFYEYVVQYMKGTITADDVYKTAFEIYGMVSTFSNLGDLFNRSVYYYARPKMNELLALEGKKLDEDNIIPKDSDLYKNLDMFLSTITDVVLNVELKRGDSETIFSKSISSIREIYGMERLIEILKALGKDTLKNSWYMYGMISKKDSLGHLLACCMPKDGDTAEKLGRLIKNTDITTDRLIETAMFAPQWIDIIEEYLGIAGFKLGCYYFMAHTAEHLSDKRLAIIARYTPLSADELRGGCFDVKWFREAYDMLGDKAFNKLYKSAKYISSSNQHTRARKFADAALGKMDIAQTETQISDKRNKDLLLSLAIIPSENDSDILERYEFIQNFIKESRKFGAQRRASEGTAAEYALKNLAVTAGYSDETRLSLSMETALVKNNANYFDVNDIDGYGVRINVDVHGKAALVIEKGSKTLKTVPAAIKKNAQFLEIKAFCDKLRKQYSRTVKMFEAAMENREYFTLGELLMLSENPVTKAITENLVFVCDDSNAIGFICTDGLSGTSGDIMRIDTQMKIRPAHPFDLYKSGQWSDFQNTMMKRGHDDGRKQPFRQIFRELYLKLPEEAEKTRSLMFAGNQIQPQRTVGALKNRRWIADYEDGLQKIYYADNIIAELYAVADWFSPSDIEAPTLEGVVFIDRKTYKQLKISEIPDIIYSEVMRDVDLAVSVAHAGGVDPETSHSTIEMRRVIIEFNLSLFGINNVTLDKNHAIIDGKLGKYTVHLGSGVIHKMGGSAVNVIAVSSGKKSKLFLPFIDEDPKTAEIMTKIITFAQDDKIKDPFIMQQLK